MKRDPTKFQAIPEDFTFEDEELGETGDEKPENPDKIISKIELSLKNLKSSIKGNKI